MSGRGRPIRFLAVLFIGWTGVRVAMLWPAVPMPEALQALSPVPASRAAVAGPIAPGKRQSPPISRLGEPLPMRLPIAAPAMAGPERAVEVAFESRPRSPAAALASVPSMLTHVPEASGFIPVQAVPDRLAPLPDRWSATGWVALRPGQGLGAAPAGAQLGGSQAGLRIAWLALPRTRMAAVARVVAPLKGRGSEVAAGVEWQPFKVPVRLVAEHRFGLDGVKGGPGIGMIAGQDVQRAGFRLESYGQAGVLRRERSEPYADGAVRGLRVVRGEGIRVALGAGVWGAAQRGVERLDIGPSAVIGFPVARGQARLTIDWRQRVAGSARPGSGPALTLGSDF